MFCSRTRAFLCLHFYFSVMLLVVCPWATEEQLKMTWYLCCVFAGTCCTVAIVTLIRGWKKARVKKNVGVTQIKKRININSLLPHAFRSFDCVLRARRLSRQPNSFLFLFLSDYILATEWKLVRRRTTRKKENYRRNVKWFVLLFVIWGIGRSLGVVSDGIRCNVNVGRSYWIFISITDNKEMIYDWKTTIKCY